MGRQRERESERAVGYLWGIQRSLTVIFSSFFFLISNYISYIVLVKLKPPQLYSLTRKDFVWVWDEAKCAGVAVSWELRTTADCYANCLLCLWMDFQLKSTPIVPKCQRRHTVPPAIITESSSNAEYKEGLGAYKYWKVKSSFFAFIM